MTRGHIAVAIVGYGYWGSKHVRVFSAMPDVAVTIVDTDPSRLTAARRDCPGARLSRSLDEVLREVDAVVVATPSATHARLALAAIRADRHVFVEKPLATSSADCEALVDAAEAHGVVLMSGHTFEHHAAVWKLRELVSDGHLGDIRYIDCARLSLGLYQADVNVIWDLAPHDVSIVNYLLGRPPVGVSAWGHSHASLGAEDVAHIQLRYTEPDIRAYIHVSWLAPCKVRRVTVVGSRKMAVYNDMAGDERIRVYDVGVDHVSFSESVSAPGVSYRRGDIVSPFIAFEEPLAVQNAHLLECIRDGRTPRTDGNSGLAVARVLEAANNALISGREVALHTLPVLSDADGPDIDLTRVRPELPLVLDGDASRVTITSSDRIPFLDLAAQHDEIRSEIDDAWARVTAANAFVGGAHVERFEAEFADYCGVRHCIGVANGTDALMLILASLSVDGQEVIVPGNTFVATVEAIVAAGAIPVFVDVDPRTLLVSAEHVADAISARTAAVIVVHLYGQMPDMDAIGRVAARAGYRGDRGRRGKRTARGGGDGARVPTAMRPRSASIRARTWARSATQERSRPTTPASRGTSAPLQTTDVRRPAGTSTTSSAATAGSTDCRPRSCR